MNAATKISKRIGVMAVLIIGAAALLAAAPASAAPKWRIESLSNTAAQPGGTHEYVVQITNIGDQSMEGEIDLTGTLPGGMTAHDGVLAAPEATSALDVQCTAGDGSPIEGAGDFKCAYSEGLDGTFGFQLLHLNVDVDPGAAGILTPSFEVSGGGAASASTLDPTRITPEQSSFGLDAFDAAITDGSGAPFTQAGGHPDAVTTSFDFNTADTLSPIPLTAYPVQPTRDVVADLPKGFLGNPTSVDHCAMADLLPPGTSLGVWRPLCSTGSQVGTMRIRVPYSQIAMGPLPLYNMTPPPGVPARFATVAAGTSIVLDARLRTDGEYALAVDSRQIPDVLGVAGTSVTFWGKPGSSSHDSERACPGENIPAPPSVPIGPTCTGSSQNVFLRNPTSCTKPGEGLPWALHIDSWNRPGPVLPSGEPDLSDPAWKSSSIVSHEAPGYPANPEDPSTPWGPTTGITGCEEVPVKGTLQATPTAIDTETASGLGVTVEVPNPGLTNPRGIAASDIKAVKVALPEGMTINPSQAEGLGTCSPAQYASTRLSFHPDPSHGCPDNSKIGTVSVKTPLLEETIPGDVYVATPHENPFGTLLALYVVLHEPQRGVLIKLPAKVETNETTGQIITTFDDLPQQPFTKFEFHFREGGRAPLVTPQACGKYTTEALFTPWSNPSHTITSKSSFEIIHGIGGGPCPSGGLPPFKPGLIAGSINNNAGSYSPFNLRLFRTDAEQEITHFSIKLPPGISGKLAGVPFCSDAAIEAAKSKTGAQEEQSPSCPKASEVGHTLVGAGVGSILTYAPGKIYLAGSYHGSALSIAAITAAKVGPFDLGTVVVRQALKVDPETAEVFVDATGSDPIPHIIDGITTHLRDIRAYVDKPEFTLNPTSCDPTSTASTVLGSGLDFSSEQDDRPVTVSTRYQAVNCANLAFKPELKLSLKGGTKRAGHPALKAVLKMKGGQANIARAQVTLPKSEFLDQSHIGTVCTRVQYAKDQCPAKSIYGYARAFTPILDEPLQGPVYLRSSEHKLPDLVAGLKSGKIEIDLAGRIDSVDGQIRSTFETVPDAPVSKFVLTMQGAKKGLLENSTNLCAKAHRAIVEFDGHNGKIKDSTPVLKPDCRKAKKPKKKR